MGRLGTDNFGQVAEELINRIKVELVKVEHRHAVRLWVESVNVEPRRKRVEVNVVGDDIPNELCRRVRISSQKEPVVYMRFRDENGWYRMGFPEPLPVGRYGNSARIW